MSAPIALVGFGEVGQRLAADLRALGQSLIIAADIAFADETAAQSKAARAMAMPMAPSAKDAARGATLTISAVTAAQTIAAAQEIAAGAGQGAFVLDLNSASPDSKKAAAELVNAAGARYIEAAVMSPIHPRGLASSLLLAGPHARDFLAVFGRFGLQAQIASETYGAAAATKLCRSIMVKGLEALCLESLTTAHSYGVLAPVLASLVDLLPHPDWPGHARYMISRAREHGVRRAEELREAAAMVREGGLEALMSEAIAWREVHAARPEPAFAALLDVLQARLEAISSAKAGAP